MAKIIDVRLAKYVNEDSNLLRKHVNLSFTAEVDDIEQEVELDADSDELQTDFFNDDSLEVEKSNEVSTFCGLLWSQTPI